MTKEECEQKCKESKFWYVHCPNKVDAGDSFDAEYYDCSKCDRQWTLYYDEMR